MNRFIAALFFVAVAIGVFLRFFAPEQKIFWGDETDTALIISGHTFKEFGSLFDGRITTIRNLVQFQEPNAGRGPVAIVASLASEDAKHPPVFYILERVWAQLFGASVQALRALPAVFGVLGLLAVYWLCAELFESVATRYVAVALFAVSPFQIVYAHEAREYTYLAALTLAASAALLRALRRNRWYDWVLYGAFVAVGIYSAFLFAFVLLAHAVYVVLLQYRSIKRTVPFFLALVLGAAPFLLWVPRVIALWSSDLGWGQTAFPLKAMIFKWAFNLGALFFDAELANVAFAVVAAIFVLLEIWALYYVCRTTPKRCWLLVLCLTASTIIPFAAYDLLTGSHFSTIAKYLVPSWLGIQLATAHLFASMLGGAKRALWAAGLAATLVLGVVSSLVGLRSPIWWDNHDAVAIQSIAAAVNASAAPLLIVSPDFSTLILTHYVKNNTRVELYPKEGGSNLPHVSGQIFVLNPTPSFLTRYQRQLRLVPTGADPTVIGGFHGSVLKEQTARNLAPSRFGGTDSLWVVSAR